MAKDTVQFQRLLPGPIEKVWAYLVDSDKRKTWLADGECESKVGGKIDLYFNNKSLSSLEDVSPSEKYKDTPECASICGKVTHFSPPFKLSYTWEGENEFSEVTFELEEQDNRVLLTLTHKKLDNADLLLSVAAGWHTHLDILVAVLSDLAPLPFWQQHNKFESAYKDKLKL
ncbi:MAG: SRPBCC family protein [Pseudomonadota bacterium]